MNDNELLLQRLEGEETAGRMQTVQTSNQLAALQYCDCSEREKHILYLLTLGLADEEMAEILYVEASTIRFHLRRLQRKLDCRNRTHLATTALRLGIII
jgi:LuxR family maltose regulon positive regulatory protein